MSLDDLRRDHPWPAEKPDVPPCDHGWFQSGSMHLLGERITEETRLIIELGSWVGQSTKWLLHNTPREATVIAIDTWEGGPDHHINASWDVDVARLLPVLYETFCANLWDRRDRLVPIRMKTLDGLLAVSRAGCVADLVFVDADHSTEAVYHDILLSKVLFPDAAIVGDDWRWDSVAAGVRQAAAYHEMSIVIDKNAWALEPR